MTVIWLLVWLCSGAPAVIHGDELWPVALIVCGLIDIVSAIRGRSYVRSRSSR